jgi:hypothetical protein
VRATAASSEAARNAAALAAALPPQPFTLVLQSTLALPDGGQARINGQTLDIGQALLGVDAQAPPVLAAVTGSIAVVRHRGREHVLDLDGQARIDVGGTPHAGAALASSTGNGHTNVPANGTGSGPAAKPAAKPAGAAKAPGKMGGSSAGKKKGVYKSRSKPKQGA